MILVLGGTTEGRKAVEVLEESGSTYYYSTKTKEQEVALHHGIRLHGTLDQQAMVAFCREHDIQLLVDAAHPFAKQLHETVAEVAKELRVPAIRYERIFPERDSNLTWIDDYSQVPTNIHSLLATTGVHSIAKLKPLEAKGIKIYYRILPRESSIRLAKAQGATDEQLLYYEDSSIIDTSAEAILLKESGLSGGFQEKVDAAKAKGMRIIVLKRPATSDVFHIVNGPHGLRRMVEQLLPDFYPLHSGLTTGTCATAAAVGATLRLLKNETPAEVPVILPNGETIHVPVTYGDGYVSVFKEAGDDPDVTNGIEVRVSVKQITKSDKHSEIIIEGGKGVGRFTLPGFDYPPGVSAINKAPRQMIEENILHSSFFIHHSSFFIHHSSLKVTISVPDGEEIARRTFNPRLGIEGGISIIGVSGIVKPFSEEAFIQSIRKCMEVAKASGSERVVINSGAKSERFVRAYYPTLPSQAFVEYGNYIGETLKIAHELGFKNVTLGVMLGKAVKLAAGNLDTHSKKTVMDKTFIASMLEEAHCPIDLTNLTLARELWERIPKKKTEDFCRVVIHHCLQFCEPIVPQAALTLLLIDDDGTIHSL
ncbi:MAG: cobalamin biosynthesis protein CbiD [Paludibacteraceae bacterium]|nr:cobalamin biosynthesis protein CbiD [Paludibacteraceae bacterium]MBQ8715099.1 cobalamin biosynthesis protein CbiD [Prevotella sp.]